MKNCKTKKENLVFKYSLNTNYFLSIYSLRIILYVVSLVLFQYDYLLENILSLFTNACGACQNKTYFKKTLKNLFIGMEHMLFEYNDNSLRDLGYHLNLVHMFDEIQLSFTILTDINYVAQLKLCIVRNFLYIVLQYKFVSQIYFYIPLTFL